MDLESVLVTGANRGIGLELVRQLVHSATPPRFIFATHRTTDCQQELEEIAKGAPDGVKLILVQMDVTSSSDISAARAKVEETLGASGLQLLVNNAGILLIQRRFPSTTEDNLKEHFATNTVAPVMIFKEMYPLLQKSAAARKEMGLSVSRAAVLNISSFAGSMGEAWLPPRSWLASIGYRTSKAALNMSMRLISATVRDSGVLVINMCPGWVKTTLGGEEIADIEPEESVKDILRTLPTLGDAHQGAFIDRHGKAIPF